MDKTNELDDLLESLVTPPQVYVRSGRVAKDVGVGKDGIAAELYALVLDAQDDWQESADPHVVGPQSAWDVAKAIDPVAEAAAEQLLADLSMNDLVWSAPLHRDPDHVSRTARRVVSLLGPGTTWWANIEAPGGSRGWDPVTRLTFDGAVAGVAEDGTFAILLQVGED